MATYVDAPSSGKIAVVIIDPQVKPFVFVPIPLHESSVFKAHLCFLYESNQLIGRMISMPEDHLPCLAQIMIASDTQK